MKQTGITVRGFDSVARLLIRMADKGRPALLGALREEAEKVMTDAKENYVPVDLGSLKSSGFVEQHDVMIVLGFGGPSAPYALVVHEDLHARHTTGSAKYLEIPLNKAKSGMRDRIIVSMQRSFGK